MTMEEVAESLLQGFGNADANLDGHLSFAEAQGMLSALTRSTFDALDSDSDGLLTEAELRGALPDSGGGVQCPGASGKRWDGLLGDLFLLGLALVALLGAHRTMGGLGRG